ncbi:DUF3862 domain-containing protein [Lentilactobacillus diolivorans]|uniref:DUF3862 domain-containing protein n=2 Tax=Lentilactobacillus diolivorans TaxID=179838 RepID=A0A0R1S7S6_9LACO|nr:DUF3862 domain-containing protein [Lentilactobacillus diolivorans]KRL64542.1 hypothetical protein FC85_GL001052 [Lentilactobacillus diolivorans DSM 14421]MDH5104236.1 DUF3862 domain-containing protein [Lentilactobacillus diolivorans]GEP22889.1 hypothetical protein LDI01_04820 [Lentilactobacillus diolivorans]
MFMKKSVVLAVTVLASLSLAACGNSSKSKSGSNKTSSSQTQDLSKNITLANYKKIKVGIMTGQGGATESSVKAKFGTPSSKSKASKTEIVQYSWSKVDPSFKVADVTIHAIDGKVVGKAYDAKKTSGMKITSKSRLAGIKKGDSYNATLKTLGTPNGESIMGAGKNSLQQLTYATDKNGNAVTFSFNQNKLNAKTTATIN